MPPIELSPEDWVIVRDILQRFIPEREVWAFGSRARGGAKIFSDLDLAVLGPDRLPPALVSDLAEAFDESDLSVKVDVLDWNTASGAFRKIVEQDRVVVQPPLGKPIQALLES